MNVTAPLPPAQANKLLKRIVSSGGVRFSGHALQRMEERNMLATDVINVLRCGRMTEPAEEVQGTWRYRIHTATMGVAVAFRSETEVAVVTAWRET